MSLGALPYRLAYRSMSAAPTRDLTAVLLISDPADFMQALARLDGLHAGIDFIDRPRPLGMLGGLHALYSDVTLGGIGKFLNQREGAGFDATLAWCEEIGAQPAAAYLKACALLFPG